MELKVNTIIIGAGRSGTTTLYKMMEQHPDICFSDIKEVHYFSDPDLYKRGEDYLHSFYTKCKNETVVAVADTYLLVDHDGIARLHDYSPEIKIIVVLNNKMTQADFPNNFSANSRHHDINNSVSKSIIKESVLNKDPAIVRRNKLGSFSSGMYHFHLKKCLEVFGKDQFLMVYGKDLKAEPEKLAEKLFQFLNIPCIHL